MNEFFTLLPAIVVGFAGGLVFAKRFFHCNTCACEVE